MLHLNLWSFQSLVELGMLFFTEKYSPVSTAKRSTITRQKETWYPGGKNDEMDDTAKSVRRSGEMGKKKKKKESLRQIFGTNSEVTSRVFDNCQKTSGRNGGKV